MGEQATNSRTPGAAIDSSNIGFKLLKKQGWKEGTGLGVSEQGRLDPVQAQWKNDKRGLGLETKKKKNPKSSGNCDSKEMNDQEDLPSNKSKRKTKTMSKKMRKMKELEKRLEEKEFERAFFREFWPDNV